MRHGLKFALLALAGLSTLGLGACAREVMREEVAMRVATPAWMVKREIDAGPFQLVAFERMHERGSPATLYIEGDGKADEARDSTLLFDATPVNPVALHLATKDKAENLAYLARPCQYTESYKDNYDKVTERPDAETFCGEHWAGGQYSPETLAAYGDVLDRMKRRYDITAFHIVGYDGGATLAAALAASRRDVLSFRSVAGKFDLPALERHIPALRSMPQHHFIGGADTVTPPAVLHNYLQALGHTECVEYTMIQEAEHEKGWVDKWPGLLKTKVPTCRRPVEPEFVPIQKPEPIYYPRDFGDKK